MNLNRNATETADYFLQQLPLEQQQLKVQQYEEMR